MMQLGKEHTNTTVQFERWSHLQSEVGALRLTEWQTSSPWLASEFPDGVDAYDSKSAHATLRAANMICGAVRFSLDAPEIHACSTRFSGFASAHSNYAEIGRFVVSGTRFERVVRSSDLLVQAGRSIYQGLVPFDRTPSGLMAICRKERLGFFSRFGFTPAFESPEYVLNKQGHYWLIHASWDAMIRRIRNENLNFRGEL
jgi:hypothetical protein